MKVTILVIGNRDMEANAVSLRVHGKGNLGAKPARRVPARGKRLRRSAFSRHTYPRGSILRPTHIHCSLRNCSKISC